MARAVDDDKSARRRAPERGRRPESRRDRLLLDESARRRSSAPAHHVRATDQLRVAMMTRLVRHAASKRAAVPMFALLLGFVPALNAVAQANLSSQGFGYPTGQFSTRTYGTGGALAELDPLSPVN